MTSRLGSSSTIRIRGAVSPYGPGPPYMAGGYQRGSGAQAPEADPVGPAIGVAGVQPEALRPRAPGGCDLIGRGRGGIDELEPEPLPVVARPFARRPPTSTAGARRSSRAGATSISTRPPGATSPAMPRATSSSRASAPRSSEPHGSWITTRSGDPDRAPAGGASAAAATNRAFGQAAVSRRIGRHGGMPRPCAPALASMPMTSVVRLGGRGGQHEPAIAGAQVDHDPGRAGAPSWRLTRRPPRGRACR